MDIDSIYRAIEDRKKRNEKTDKELAEKQEYERLKEKYEWKDGAVYQREIGCFASRRPGVQNPPAPPSILIVVHMNYLMV